MMPSTQQQTHPDTHPAEQGFTLIEVSVAAAVFMIISAVSLSVAAQSTRFIAFTDADYAAQTEANRGFDRVSAILRKCGWNAVGTDAYPAVTEGSTAFDFNRLGDLDGNGYPYNAATGEVEWTPQVLQIRLSADGFLQVHSADDEVVHVLAHWVQSVSFATYKEDPTLHYREVHVVITTVRPGPDGESITHTVDGSVYMRN